MAASRYRSFLQLLQQWPVDKLKGDRDLGLFMKKQILTRFPQGEASVVDIKECDKTYNSLVRISNDVHRNKWARLKSTNASGASEDEIKRMLYLNEEEDDKGVINKLKEKYFNKK